MTVKAPRGLTHAKRLYEPDGWVERICAGWRALGDKTGALLVQMHPLRLKTAVPEREARMIRVGQSVQLTVEGTPGKHGGRQRARHAHHPGPACRPRLGLAGQTVDRSTARCRGAVHRDGWPRDGSAEMDRVLRETAAEVRQAASGRM
jgi:hypothetical protein